MEDFIRKDGKILRTGYTTGTCAAAAAKAAAWMLLSGKERKIIKIITPKGIPLDLDILEISITENEVRCAVCKDSGDDPDVTNGMLIFACVKKIRGQDIVIDGGEGIGRVTKLGLDQPVGAAAINSVPRKMILDNIKEVCELFDYQQGLSVIIYAPEGEKIAKKTFNERLGVLGGISILGTTGIVEPMSDRALIDTIRLELNQRRIRGSEYVLLTPGNYGINFLRENFDIDPKIPVMTSNFIGDALDACRELGFRGVLLTGHIGKLVKIAGGMLNTHSRYGDCRMEILASYAGACGVNSTSVKEILNCVTCDEALRILKVNQSDANVLSILCGRISDNLNRRTEGNPRVEAILFSNVYGTLCRTNGAVSLLDRIREEA